MKLQKIGETALNLLFIAVGSVMLALSVNLFFQPNNIVPGGINGVAMLIYHFVPSIALGTWILILNLPLFLLAWKFLGLKFIIYSLIGTVISSVAINLTTSLPPIDAEPLMAVVAGGALMGIGIGFVFMRGATTGGSDVIARLLKIPFPHMRMGILMLAIDGIVVASSVLLYGITIGLYSAVTVFVASKAIDAVLYGSNTERVAYIISEKQAEIVSAIDIQLGRGATYLNGEGTFSHQPKQIILCAIKRQQIAILKNIVKHIDSNAFVIVTEAHEVLGEGFQRHDSAHHY